MRIYFSKQILALVIGLGLSVCDARAGLIPTDVTSSVEGSANRFTYSVTLTSDLSVHPGDFFTIYDFAGFVPGSNAQPANFTFSSALTGPTPPRLAPADDPTIENLTWTYNGPVTTLGQNLLGNFSALSIYGSTEEGTFTAQTHRIEGGTPNSNITDTPVPVPTAPQVPEPTTLLMLGLAVPFWGAKRWIRNSTSV